MGTLKLMLVWAQQVLFPSASLGPPLPKEGKYALVGLRVWVSPAQKLPPCALLLQDGKIQDIVDENKVPPEYVVYRYPKGFWAYPAFVEPTWMEENLPSPQDKNPHYEPTRRGTYPYDAVQADRNLDTGYVVEPMDQLRQMGFAVVHVLPMRGTLRGKGTVLALREGYDLRYKSYPTLHIGLRKNAISQDYPASKMGNIALIRQFFYDVLGYTGQPPNALLQTAKKLLSDTCVIFWHLENPEDAFRAYNLTQEFRKHFPRMQVAYIGSGYEYENAPFLSSMGGKLIHPIGLPVLEKHTSLEPYLAMRLQTLRRWEWAPYAPQLYRKHRISFVLSSRNVKKPEHFWRDFYRIARARFSVDTLLLQLTQLPAQLLGLSQVGKIAKGYQANLIITSDSLGDPQAKLVETWVQGTRFSYEAFPSHLPDGLYTVSWQGKTYLWHWEKSLPPWETRLYGLKDTVKIKVDYEKNQATGILPAQLFGDSLPVRTVIEWKNADTLTGWAVSPLQRAFRWQALRKDTTLKKPPKTEKEPEKPLSRLSYPNIGYGLIERPPVENVVFRRATVWTGKEILPGTDVWIRDGKIQAVGKNLSAPKAQEIDAQGKHLTAGIIDEHSHIAIEGGVNEATEAVTSEVRIRDVIDPTDVNLYRQLAGGVTAAQLLHGSANPIGGQAACIKFRWGLPAESLLIADAPPFNKFALGENVKQSNWGDAYTLRYPQSRLGVEAILRAAFEEALAYKQNPTPRNLRLEALAEILDHKRFITCHSYVQSEILMLMHLAQEKGFRVRTFTHVLEGYKVAPQLKAHGAYASTFSDWWAYKYEVIDAIPFNAAILLQAGVPTCINSDDAEMARRLNQEAAKILRYGGTDSVEAWKTVTLYPAQALGIEYRTGSIEKGKDADLVLWNSSPLHIKARVLATWVEGRRLYDENKEIQVQRAIRKEKEALARKALQYAEGQDAGPQVLEKKRFLWHCDDFLPYE
ncbi:MAG: amidohydrolase family protein [Bacteroidia bacterium]